MSHCLILESNVSPQYGVVEVLGQAERCWWADGGGRGRKRQPPCISMKRRPLWGRAETISESGGVGRIGMLLGRWACSPPVGAEIKRLHCFPLQTQLPRSVSSGIPPEEWERCWYCSARYSQQITGAVTLWIVQKHTEAIRRKSAEYKPWLQLITSWPPLQVHFRHLKQPGLIVELKVHFPRRHTFRFISSETATLHLISALNAPK